MVLETFLPEHARAIQVCPYKYIPNGVLNGLTVPLHSCLVTIRGEIEGERCIRAPWTHREGRAEPWRIPWCVYVPAPDSWGRWRGERLAPQIKHCQIVPHCQSRGCQMKGVCLSLYHKPLAVVSEGGQGGSVLEPLHALLSGTCQRKIIPNVG